MKPTLTEAEKQTIKLVRHNAARIQEDDAAIAVEKPWRFRMFCRPPEFMDMAFIGMIGPQEIVVVRGSDLEILRKFIAANDFEHHPRRQVLTLDGPGFTEILFPGDEAGKAYAQKELDAGRAAEERAKNPPPPLKVEPRERSNQVRRCNYGLFYDYEYPREDNQYERIK